MLNVIGAKTVTYSSPPKLRATDVIRVTATSFVELAIPSEQGAPPRKIEPVQDEAQSVERRSCRCARPPKWTSSVELFWSDTLARM